MSVCAAIVTYHPALAELRSNLARLRPQVETVLLVDNASPAPLRDGLRALVTEFDCELIENSENRGIGEALNQSVIFARERNAEFVLFFDQDSGVSPDFVARQLETYREAARHARVGLVAPTVLKRPSMQRMGPVRLRNGSPILAQTSGALMPLPVFAEVGLFRADMFIDYVDYEHCLRMAQKDWKIAWAELAELDHMPGNGTPVRFFGRPVITVNASPLRHYYETRNCLWVVRHYLASAPEMSLRLLLRMMYVRLHALFFERNRNAKLIAALRGAFDALRGRLGRRPIR